VSKIFKPVGCEHCGGTGFFGRIALHEILRVDKNISELILYSRDLEKIRQTALKGGLKTLATDGIEKVRAGLTTLEELQIILGEEVDF
jgi:type II secretory ATPase GspE/PulE/Tfp pilus assembly ATPase PilB-like protein